MRVYHRGAGHVSPINSLLGFISVGDAKRPWSWGSVEVGHKS